MADEIFLELVWFFNFVGAVWFLWLWPKKLSQTLTIKDRSKRLSFIDFFFASCLIYGGALGTPSMVLVMSLAPDEMPLPSAMQWVVLLFGAAMGLTAFAMLKRRLVIWGGIIGIYWLGALAVTIRSPNIYPNEDAIALLIAATFVVPLTVYIKRHWHEFQ